MSLLEQVVLFLATAVVLVPLFQKLRLGAVLGYLAAGMVIGPWGFGFVPDAAGTLHFAEFGVVLLLFLVGLELDPTRLWALRRPLFGLGGAQVLLTSCVLAAVVHVFVQDWRIAVVAGIGGAMSSTALVISTLTERNELSTRHGRESFAVLLFQDLAVIPVLALLPLLAGERGTEPGWIVAAKGLSAIALVVVASRTVVRPVLKFIAVHSSREVFTAAALLLVVGAALLMEHMGLSMSLGAFLAGVLLANSEFRHELEADIEPFKGLLLGLFFMAVGMTADLGLLIESPGSLLGAVVALLAIKFAVMYAIARMFGTDARATELTAVLLSEGGEFAFVLFSAAAALAVLDQRIAAWLIMAVTLSMLVAPVLFTLHRRWLARRDERSAEPEYDEIDGPAHPVIIAGFGRFGQIVARVLRMCGIGFTALEISYQQVDFVRRFGNRIYYGDASRLDLLHAARAGQAKLFVLAIDDVEASVRTAALVRSHFPGLPIVARARNRVHYFRLRDLGIEVIHRETFPASLDAAREVLLRLGLGATAAGNAVNLFRQHDEAQLQSQYAVHQDEAQLIQTTVEAAAQLQELFEADRANAALAEPAAPGAKNVTH